MNALVLINKPVGLRSTNCVAIVRKALGGLKVGHAGTLDSTASGLLILLAGQATRLCEYVMSLPKVYRVVIQFGAETDTADYSGEIVSAEGWESLDAGLLMDSLYGFAGWRLQSPPPVSAVKIDGVPAYKLARSGQDPEMKARPVFFRRIDVITPYDAQTGTLELEVHCGRGTYIRSLARDLGKITGCGAHVKSLCRTAVGRFTLDDAESPDAEDFSPVSLSELAKNYTRIHVGSRDAKSFTNGMSILLRQALSVHRGIALINNALCVYGEEFIGFGKYAGYDYVQPVVIVPK
ncbi:MAG: tRNA pseudouridine(55) synthase TruB [Synergistaceae bacterium]|nr:tRNA pseudouridine(55) synthase TruB [Synergistaceae bacterium]